MILFLVLFSSSGHEINTCLKKVLHPISCNHAEVFNLFQILPVTFQIYIFTFVPSIESKHLLPP